MTVTFDLAGYRKSLSFLVDEEKHLLSYWRDFFDKNYNDEGLRYLWQSAEGISKSVSRINLLVFIQDQLTRYADQETLEGIDTLIPVTLLSGRALSEHSQVDKEFYGKLVETTTHHISPFMPRVVV